MTAPHPVAATIDGLIALWRGAPELVYDVGGVRVQLRVDDTLLMEELDEPRSLVVGAGSQFAPGSPSTSSSYGYGDRTDQLEVSCELHVWSGDTNPAVVRTEALEVLDELTRLLLLNRDLGGVVDWARVSRSTYTPSQDATGAKALIEFTVRVDAHREGA